MRITAPELLCSPSSNAAVYRRTCRYVPDILEKRTPYRAAHIEGAKKQVRVLFLCVFPMQNKNQEQQRRGASERQERRARTRAGATRQRRSRIGS